MCMHCDKVVIDMGILESDLPNLPFKLVKWVCIVDGCTCGTKMRDYGISPIFWWPVKITRKKDGSYRGGWTDFTHGYICNRHWPEYKQGHTAFFEKYATNRIDITRSIVAIEKSKQYKPKR